MIRLDIVTQYVVLAGLIGAIVWDVLTWLLGLPTSSSHALIGGYAGAAHGACGHRPRLERCARRHHSQRVDQDPDLHRRRAVLGFILGFSFMVAISWIFQRRSPRQVDRLFRRLQLLSAAAYSLGHGGNDAQKTMGIVAGALYTAGVLSKHDFEANWGRWHWPIILAAQTAIALGTYFGGWRIVHTMGSKITKLKPVGGFCAEAAGAITLFGTALAGIPGQHYAHHYRRHRRRGNDSSDIGGAMGHRRADCLGLGSHHSRVSPGRDVHVLVDSRVQGECVTEAAVRSSLFDRTHIALFAVARAFSLAVIPPTGHSSTGRSGEKRIAKSEKRR